MYNKHVTLSLEGTICRRQHANRAPAACSESVCRSEIVIPRVASSLQKGPAFLSYWSQRRAGK